MIHKSIHKRMMIANCLKMPAKSACQKNTNQPAKMKKRYILKEAYFISEILLTASLSVSIPAA